MELIRSFRVFDLLPYQHPLTSSVRTAWLSRHIKNLSNRSLAWPPVQNTNICNNCLFSENETKPEAEIDGYTAHVNNVTYARWVESSRVGYIKNFAKHHDPENKSFWDGLTTPKGTGLILKKLQIEYKLVSEIP